MSEEKACIYPLEDQRKGAITEVEKAAEKRYGNQYKTNKQCMQIACFKAGAEWQSQQAKLPELTP